MNHNFFCLKLCASPFISILIDLAQDVHTKAAKPCSGLILSTEPGLADQGSFPACSGSRPRGPVLSAVFPAIRRCSQIHIHIYKSTKTWPGRNRHKLRIAAASRKWRKNREWGEGTKHVNFISTALFYKKKRDRVAMTKW